MENTGTSAKNEKLDNPAGGQKSGMEFGGGMRKEGEGNRDPLNFGGAEKAVAGTVTNLKEGVTHLTDKAQETITDVAHKTQKWGEKAVKGTRSYVTQNPGQSLLVGFGAGFLIGYAFSRK